MARSASRSLPLWVVAVAWSAGIAALLLLLHDAPLVRGPAADLRQAVPPFFSFAVLLFTGWFVVLVPVVFLALLALRRGLLGAGGAVAAVGALFAAGVFLYPVGRWAVLRGRFLRGEHPPQVLFLGGERQGLGTLVILSSEPGDENVLLRRIRQAGTERRPVLSSSPFYPEPDWDDFAAVELGPEAMRRAAASAAWWTLRRPRPLEVAGEEAGATSGTQTVLLVGEDGVYGVTAPRGGLKGLASRLEADLPADSRARLGPWLARGD